MNPHSIDEQAPVIARHSAVVAAPLDLVWRLHTDINAWPTWQEAIDEAHLAGPLRGWYGLHLAHLPPDHHLDHLPGRTPAAHALGRPQRGHHRDPRMDLHAGR